MTKFYGPVGYAELTITAPGVTEEIIKEYNYYGDVIRNARRLEQADRLNDNVVVNNSISVIADAYAYEHFYSIRYVKWNGVKWKVSNVDVQMPRLVLTLGAVYNGV